MREVDDTGEGECLLLTTNYSLSLSLSFSLCFDVCHPGHTPPNSMQSRPPPGPPSGGEDAGGKSKTMHGVDDTGEGDCLLLTTALSLCFDVCHPGHTPPAYMHNRSPPGPPSGGRDAGGKSKTMHGVDDTGEGDCLLQTTASAGRAEIRYHTEGGGDNQRPKKGSPYPPYPAQ